MNIKQRALLSLGLALAVSVLATLGLNTIVGWARFPVAEKIIPTIGGEHAVAGRPTISPAHMDQILESHRSPMAGHGQQIYDLGMQYGIDPVYAMAFFMHESNFGTAGWAKVTLNPGNIRGSGQGGWTYFRNWDDGIEAWFRLIQRYSSGAINFTNPQGFGCTPPKPCRLVEQIIPVYAPSTDGNNVNAYISSVAGSVDTWHTAARVKGLPVDTGKTPVPANGGKGSGNAAGNTNDHATNGGGKRTGGGGGKKRPKAATSPEGDQQ